MTNPDGPTQPPRPEHRRRLLRRVLLGIGTSVVLGPAVAFGVGYVLLPVPTPDDAVERQAAVLSYADGSTLTRLAPGRLDRAPVAIETVPVPVRQAMTAVRDDADPITEQYLDTAYGDSRSLWRRYRELVVSVKIARERPDEEIFGDYLNAVYFGRGAYGIAAASRAYFGKDVADLTVAEGALLAGVIGAPPQSDPATSPDQGVARWSAVLDDMLARGWLTSAQRAGLTMPATLPRRAGPGPAGADGHLNAAVVAELAEIGVTERDVAQGGLRVTTTIDPVRQRHAVAVAETAAGSGPGAAIVVIDPASGGVLAYYGGPADADEVRVAGRAGVAFTPFAVLAGLRPDVPFGPRSVADAARTAGVNLPADGSDPTATPAVTPMDLASAYATIAADGVWHRPHLVAAVTAADGRVLYRASADGGRRFSPDDARRATAPLLDAGIPLPHGGPVAVVTAGAVTAGFTPSLVAVVRLPPDREPPSALGPSPSETVWRDLVVGGECTVLSPCG